MKPIRALLLELAIHSRSTIWIHESKIAKVKFTASPIENEDKAKTKLEAVVYSYFVERVDEACYINEPRLRVGGLLVSQLLKFALTGSAASRDRDVCSVLGEV